VIDMLQDITSLERFNLDSKQIKMQFDLEGVRQYDWVKADKQRISQIYLNLLQNAIKFSEVGKEIEVTCWYDAPKGRIRFSVVDFGQGIPAEDQHRLFTQYGRIKSGEAMNPNGIGLGLYICKLLCNTLGGRIKCISKPMISTDFTFFVHAKAIKAKKE
jgi:signal transduction histidine kinase